MGYLLRICSNDNIGEYITELLKQNESACNLQTDILLIKMFLLCESRYLSERQFDELKERISDVINWAE